MANNRGVFTGGLNVVPVNTMDYITITSTGNATDFGNLTEACQQNGGASNRTNERGCIALGRNSDGDPINVIDYITINSTGNGTDFGDLTVARRGNPTGVSNA